MALLFPQLLIKCHQGKILICLLLFVQICKMCDIFTSYMYFTVFTVT